MPEIGAVLWLINVTCSEFNKREYCKHEKKRVMNLYGQYLGNQLLYLLYMFHTFCTEKTSSTLVETTPQVRGSAAKL